jgi:DnaJ-class molecular chaperone
MPNKVTCPKCDGKGGYYALVSPHDDVKEWVTCPKCDGKGHIHQMTDEEEEDYRRDNW